MVRAKHCTWLDHREALLPWDNKSERCHPWLRRRKIPSEASPRLPIMVTHSPKHCFGVKQYSVTKTTLITTLWERLLKIVDQLHEGAAPPSWQALKLNRKSTYQVVQYWFQDAQKASQDQPKICHHQIISCSPDGNAEPRFPAHHPAFFQIFRRQAIVHEE